MKNRILGKQSREKNLIGQHDLTLNINFQSCFVFLSFKEVISQENDNSGGGRDKKNQSGQIVLIIFIVLFIFGVSIGYGIYRSKKKNKVVFEEMNELSLSELEDEIMEEDQNEDYVRTPKKRQPVTKSSNLSIVSSIMSIISHAVVFIDNDLCTKFVILYGSLFFVFFFWFFK